MPAQPVTRLAQHAFTIDTRGRGTLQITSHLRAVLEQNPVRTGLLHVFTHHTSCSLMITENADPAVHADLERYFARLVPDGDPLFAHDAEGPDDMPAHVRSVLTATSISVPVTDGRLALGTWQGVYLWEHRARGTGGTSRQR